MMSALAILALLVFNLYLLAVMGIFHRVPTSLSNTYYMLEDLQQGAGWWFTGMMLVLAFLVMPPMIQVTDENWRFVAFFAPAAIAFVGAAPQFREAFTEKVHVIAANVAAVTGLLWTVFLTPCWWALPISMTLCLSIAIRSESLKTCKTFWLEMIAFASVFIALLFVTFKSMM